jgi:hypothetical protein
MLFMPPTAATPLGPVPVGTTAPEINKPKPSVPDAEQRRLAELDAKAALRGRVQYRHNWRNAYD